MSNTELLRKRVGQMIEHGSCDIECIDFQDVANRAKDHEGFSEAIRQSVNRSPAYINLIIMNATVELIQAFS